MEAIEKYLKKFKKFIKKHLYGITFSDIITAVNGEIQNKSNCVIGKVEKPLLNINK